MGGTGLKSLAVAGSISSVEPLGSTIKKGSNFMEVYINLNEKCSTSNKIRSIGTY
jgi:hypothetical protein